VSQAPSSRPGRGTLSRDTLLAAALALIDRDGLESLTMRRLGAELGVEAMSLYNHVENKDALLDGVCEVMVGEIVSHSPAPDEPREASKADLRALRRVALRHPHAFPLLATRPIGAYTATREVAERALRRFRAAGWDDQGAMRALRTSVRFVLGFAMSESQSERSETVGAGAGRGTPLVDELLRQIASDDSNELFEFGLDVVLDGLESQLRRRSAGGT